jgi:hypothetical protein
MIRNACNLIYKDAIHHVTYVVQNAAMHKGKLYICYKGASPPTQETTTHTKLTNDRLLEGRQKGSTPPTKEQKSTKLTRSP